MTEVKVNWGYLETQATVKEIERAIRENDDPDVYLKILTLWEKKKYPHLYKKPSR